MILAAGLEANQLQFLVLFSEAAGDSEDIGRSRRDRRRRRHSALLEDCLSVVGTYQLFLLVVNIVYAFFDTFGIIHNVTQGGPARATEILVYRVWYDGVVGLDLGGSAAQSVILMAIVIGLTAIQFRFIERRVHYA